MHADHAIDDELESRESDAAMRDSGEVEGAVGVADVHHDLRLDLRQRVELDILLLEIERTLVDVAGIALGARHGDRHAFANRFGRIAATDDSGNTELAGDDCGVTGSAAAIRDD